MPVNKQEYANNDNTQQSARNSFPGQETICDSSSIFNGIATGQHHDHIAGEFTGNEGRNNMHWLYLSHAGCCK